MYYETHEQRVERRRREAEVDEQKTREALAAVRAEAEQIVEEQLRQQLAGQEQEHVRQREDALREYAFAQIFRLPIDGRVAQDTIANRKEIASWVDDIHGEVLSREWFARILTTENPTLAKRLSWQSADAMDPRKKAAAEATQADDDRSTFNAFARANGFSEIEANFRLAVSVLGSGFNQYQLEQAVTSNALRLARASQQELAQYAQDAAEARQDWLVNQASPAELREAANRESEQRRAAAAQQQADQQLEAAVVRDSVMGFPPLPEDWRGQKLDANFIKMCDVATHKLLLKRFGSAQLDLRLRGVK